MRTKRKMLFFRSSEKIFWWARVDYASRAAKNSPLGCFCAVFCDSAAAVRIHPPSPEKISAKQKIQYPVRILDFLVGAGGFEPPKLKAADLQSVPIGHSGTRPYSFLCVRSPDDLLILAWEMDFVNCFLLFSSKVFCARRRRGAAMWMALCENGGHPSFLLQKYLLDKRQIRRLRIAFCAILCYNFGRTEQKTAGAFCRFARWEG